MAIMKKLIALLFALTACGERPAKGTVVPPRAPKWIVSDSGDTTQDVPAKSFSAGTQSPATANHLGRALHDG
jgi:predicted small lipoprotein YifL